MSPEHSPLPPVDRALAERLESAEALACIAYLKTRQKLDPKSEVTWTRVAGTHAIFDGKDSPLTQTFALGVFEPVTEAALTELEAFFETHGAVSAHEVSVLTHSNTWDLLSRRGYTPVEASTVLARSTEHAPRADTAVTTRLIRAHEADLWASIFAEGLSEESPEVAPIIEELGRVIARSDVACFFGELEGEPIAAAVANIQHGIAVFGGARTVRRARRRGGQAALLEARLKFAAAQGAPLAMVVTSPGSESQRNAEKQGFVPVYTRSKWQLKNTQGSRIA